VSTPLNEQLYRQLCRVFGCVKIGNEGEAMVAEYVKDPFTKRPVLNVTNAGESYNVSCPLCNDTRFRLSISHCWGVKDKLGWKNLWLANCYNNNCYSDPVTREDLWQELSEIAGVLENAAIRPGKIVTEARNSMPPGPFKLLHKLPPDHPANVYLAGRFYDPERLGRFYGVGYCEQAFHYLARNRIYVPVYSWGKLKGWQARFVGDMNWKSKDAPPKWFTEPGMKKRLLLYNLDQAKKFPTGVIVEGCADVWAFGPQAVATFGASMSPHQRRSFSTVFGKGSGVLLYDPDVQDDPDKKASYDRLVEDMRAKGRFAKGFASVILPKGSDPGSLERKFLRNYVVTEAAKQGVKVWLNQWPVSKQV
jgi:hypothetical protein